MTMNKILIPTILTATILIAGMFAFMPVQQASTVHTTIQANGVKLVVLTAVVTPEAAGADQTATWTVGAPFTVISAIASNTVDAGANNDLAVVVAATNLIDSTGIAEPNPAPFGAVGQEAAILTATESGYVVGSTTLAITTAEGGAATFAATDSVTLTVVILTRADVTTPAAVLSA